MPGELDWGLVPTVIHDAFLRAIETRKWPLYLHGATGCRKTCSMALVYAAWPGEALWIRLDETARLIGEARRSQNGFSTYWSDGNSYEFWEANFWAQVDRAALVCVDEIGSTRGFHMEVLLDLLDRRTGRPLVMTGNSSVEELIELKVDPRITSRILSGGGNAIDAGAEDLR